MKHILEPFRPSIRLIPDSNRTLPTLSVTIALGIIESSLIDSRKRSGRSREREALFRSSEIPTGDPGMLPPNQFHSP